MRKVGSSSIGGVLRDEKGSVLFMFLSVWVLKTPNESEVPAILEAICSYSYGFRDYLIIESDSSNAISWMNSRETRTC